MPTGDSHWVEFTQKLLETPADATNGYILEVDLAYPHELHPAHHDYLLAPEKMKVTKSMMSPYQHRLIDELSFTSFETKKCRTFNQKSATYYTIETYNST